MNAEEAKRQIETLKQSISRSEAAIIALQHGIRLADRKMKALELQSQSCPPGNTFISDHFTATTQKHSSDTTLRMFR